MPTTQIIGVTTANIMEVEANTLAARGTLREEDFGGAAGGDYKLAGNSGIMAAAIGTAAPIWSFRWGSSTNYALIKRLTFSAGNDSTAFTAGLVIFNLFVARSWDVSDSGGTNLTPAAGMNKLRTTGMASSALTDCRIATTAALTAGTRTLDGSPIAALGCGVPATAGSPMIPPTPMLDFRPGEHRLILAHNEGLNIRTGGVAIAATGTWRFAVTIEWTEKSSYVP